MKNGTKDKLFRMLESAKGWKVVYSTERPIGGEESACRNWMTIADFGSWDKSRDFLRRISERDHPC